MNTEEISENLIKELVPCLKERITEILKDTVTEITSQIVIHSKALIENILLEQRAKDDVKTTDKKTIDREINNFIKSNQRFMNEQLIEREKELYKYIRNVSLLDLYTECMEAEPVYVPRKWRNDKYHIMTERERTVLSNLELKRFQTECEILRLRRDDFKQRTDHIDKNIAEFIDKERISSESKEWLIKRWEECIREDEHKINKIWVEKLKGTTRF